LLGPAFLGRLSGAANLRDVKIVQIG